MHYYPTLEDSGEYYILPRPAGDPGPPQFVKRPHPAPTSTQLPDDFDALTQGATTTAHGAASEWAARVRDSGMASMNPAPLVDDFDAMTWTGTVGGTTMRRTSRFHANGSGNGYYHHHANQREDWENKAPTRTTAPTYMTSTTNTSGRGHTSSSRNPGNAREGDSTSQHKLGERKTAVRRKPSLVDLANRPEPTSYADTSLHDQIATPNDIQILIDAASCSTAHRRNNTSTSGRRRPPESGAAATSSWSASAYRAAATHSPRSPRSPRSPSRKLSSSRLPGQPYPHPYHATVTFPPPPLPSSSSRPRQTKLEYKLVDHKIIEDGPERTVTISKWREDLSGRDRPDVEMSVYFVNPDEYDVALPDEEIGMVDRDDVDKREDDELDELRDVVGTPTSMSRRGGSKQKMKGHFLTSALNQSIRQTTSEPIHSMRTKDSTQPDAHQTHRSHSPFVIKSKKAPPPTYRHPPQPHEDRYYRIFKRREDEYYNDPHEALHDPIRDENELRQRPPRPSRPRNMYESVSRASGTQREPPRSPSPFHATVSGSTISSIKHPFPSPPPSLTRPSAHLHNRPRAYARGNSEHDHTMQDAKDPITSILSTCTPSLVHLAPILLNLGISSEAHLRALAKLSKETRNKEVRGEALKRGVQVVEWAMLCDLLKEYKSA